MVKHFDWEQHVWQAAGRGVLPKAAAARPPSFVCLLQLGSGLAQLPVFGGEFLLQSLGSVTCGSPTVPSMWLLGRGNGNSAKPCSKSAVPLQEPRCASATAARVLLQEADWCAEPSDRFLWICHCAVGGEGCSSQPLPPAWFHRGKRCIEPLCLHRAAQVCGVSIQGMDPEPRRTGLAP